jgi:hypothetical protein
LGKHDHITKANLLALIQELDHPEDGQCLDEDSWAVSYFEGANDTNPEHT